MEYGTEVPLRVKKGSRLRFRQDISIEIAVSEYTFEVALATITLQDYEKRGIYSYEDLSAKYVWLCAVPTAGFFTVVFPRNGAPVKLLHHGVANLPGQIQAVVIADTNAHSNSNSDGR